MSKSNQQWIAEYAYSHQHPVNRLCHTLGIPMIVVALLWLFAALLFHLNWRWPALLFVMGWTFQFIGHAFERKPPEFFRDWRFLFVGVRWWWAKMRGHA